MLANTKRRYAVLCPLLLASASLALAISSPVASAVASKRPNIILILADDLGYADLACTGSDLYQTPNIDRFASTSLYFSHAYSSHPTCLPSRAAILTGKYPARLGIVGHDSHLSCSEHTVTESLRDAGYATCHIGKWHVGKHGVAGPREQGFDFVVASNNAGQPASYFYPFGNDAKGSRAALYAVPDLESYGPDAFLTECISSEAVKFIEAHEDRPFFLNIWHYAPHTPIQAKPDKVEKYRRLIKPGAKQQNAVYAALVEHLDDAVGRVLQAIRDNGLEEDTIVIFTSDNGGLVSNGITSNFPLRSGKGSSYEGGIRVPLFIRWPGVTPAGAVCDVPVIGHDFYPTLLRMAGVSESEQPHGEIDGSDLSPLLHEPTKDLSRDAMHWLRYPARVHFRRNDPTCSPSGAVIKGEWKLLELFATSPAEPNVYELFHLHTDPSESNDLAGRLPAKVNELQRMINEWRKSVDAPTYDSDTYSALR